VNFLNILAKFYVTLWAYLPLSCGITVVKRKLSVFCPKTRDAHKYSKGITHSRMGEVTVQTDFIAACLLGDKNKVRYSFPCS
jgi:hypothetical protein